MYFGVNAFEVGFNDSIFSGNEHQTVYIFVIMCTERLVFMYVQVRTSLRKVAITQIYVVPRNCSETMESIAINKNCFSSISKLQ